MTSEGEAYVTIKLRHVGDPRNGECLLKKILTGASLKESSSVLQDSEEPRCCRSPIGFDLLYSSPSLLKPYSSLLE